MLRKRPVPSRRAIVHQPQTRSLVHRTAAVRAAAASPGPGIEGRNDRPDAPMPLGSQEPKMWSLAFGAKYPPLCKPQEILTRERQNRQHKETQIWNREGAVKKGNRSFPVGVSDWPLGQGRTAWPARWKRA